MLVHGNGKLHVGTAPQLYLATNLHRPLVFTQGERKTQESDTGSYSTTTSHRVEVVPAKTEIG